jgi:hypothetical protein
LKLGMLLFCYENLPHSLCHDLHGSLDPEKSFHLVHVLEPLVATIQQELSAEEVCRIQNLVFSPAALFLVGDLILS